MTTRVDFAFGAPDRIDQAVTSLNKLYNRQQKALVYCPDPRRALLLSKRLWSIRPEAFVPHEIIDSPELALQSPANIFIVGQSLDVLAEHFAGDWLLNLDQHCPPDYDRYRRVLEIVSNQEQDKQRARLRWQKYRQDGADLHSTKLG